jgi:RNA polymerase sigma-70 factor, ECF subfamily
LPDRFTNSGESPSEEALLIARSRRQDADAFTEIVRRYQGRVRAYLGSVCLRLDLVDDLAQDVFLDAYRQLDAFKGESTFLTWLIGMARNKVIMRFRTDARRLSRETASVQSALATLVMDELDAQTDLATDELALTAMEHCLDKLPPHGRTIIAQRYFQRRPIDDIAREQGKRGEAVRINLFRLRRALRACIEQRLGGKAR